MQLEASYSFVPFKPDTDDRSNFNSDKAFYSFRKQRDLFYVLIHQWHNEKSGEKLICKVYEKSLTIKTNSRKHFQRCYWTNKVASNSS